MIGKHFIIFNLHMKAHIAHLTYGFQRETFYAPQQKNNITHNVIKTFTKQSMHWHTHFPFIQRNMARTKPRQRGLW